MENKTDVPKIDIKDNQERLKFLIDIADIYTSSGHYRWNDIYVLMPKYDEDKSGLLFLMFLAYFEYWILIPRVDPEEENEYFCYLAKELIKGKENKEHRLPLGNIPWLYNKYCKESEEVNG